MLSGLKVVGFCIFTVFVVATPFRHRNLNIFRIFSWPEALLDCHVVVVAKLKKCRVRSFEEITKNYTEVLFILRSLKDRTEKSARKLCME